MSVHPELLTRYLRVRHLHRSIDVPGSLTAERHLKAIDPHGILSLSLELGEERARRLLEVRVEATSTPPQP